MSTLKPKVMRKELSNRLHMFRTVNEVMDAFTDSWNGLPAIVDTKAEFVEKLVLIDEMRQKRAAIALHRASAKKASRDALITVTMRLVHSLQAYAETTNNVALWKQTHINQSQLGRISSERFLDAVQSVLANAETHLAELDVFGVTQAELTAVTDALDPYRGLIEAPRQASIQRSELLDQIELTSRETSLLLKRQLDVLIRLLPESTFTRRYVRAREIIDYGTRHHAPNENNSDGE